MTEPGHQKTTDAQADLRLCCSHKASELLLMTGPNDNHSPGPVMREVSP